MTEPKANVWFEATQGNPSELRGPVRLDRRTKMMFDARHVFINGEGFRAAGRDATLMRRLADQRLLSHEDLGRTSAQARELLQTWADAGWLHGN
jgi:50S ribosomal protein L16 3-hydroxylase